MSEQRRPHILITGAAGALAQKVIEQLRDTCDLVAVDFREQVYLGDDIPSYCIDFNKRVFEDLFRRYEFDGVIHMGRIMSSQLTRMRRYNANVLGTQKLLDLSHKYGIKRVVVLSTFHVYGAVAYNPALIDEAAPLKSAGLSADLIDSVELENLANIYLWRYPELNITILRPCNIVGPGVRNTISTLLGSERAPVLAGFSPMMQFIHIDDMADAIVLAYKKPTRGVFNVAPQDWVAYQHALKLCGCKRIQVPSIPPMVPKMILGTLKLKSFPSYLMAFFKYPVVIDGRAFVNEFGFEPKRPLKEIFRFYRENKRPV
ncbi:SDR family oxidoreductase [Marinobacter adhaerens]|jgi:UDP-glucose 4-epimerase|uniref:NAD-dependent epimerase/dehydratase family protein n=3 Tax=Marinobacter TaxID=2742 RepID=A0A3D8H7T0_9GAMM|nr:MULTISPECIES: SDR family oxidoreductase [Marinobacter]MAM88625.1 NAD-dependent epimerase [Hahellaceae bacterium]MCR9188589.1 SDR family oxidoreductase [Alteromonadaceae bacterium]ADP97653.1 NAD-dependent epimerase/dehydratase [Marinobacter adhaerens HP15]MAK48890.1 NAD-dependent epimerase [Marinobacter sp.]MBW3225600.1 SDR family oxidoreductase [Marinobacter adhaerens]|tara:strand:+ start:63 stop:1010 length:948 start_codon:yes stop_codon:yes gene_type:complete|eukprot:TRINITY_DN1004_c0_g1_i3.p1 TRINITY_DN1004_c0_g1~~TRINITY_DN1004_c0_g1_i3.p1  ORF type:complete len:316 (+),score=54.71 TRINITY_DN1004_c0_g1_i3:1765-2712(+)